MQVARFIDSGDSWVVREDGNTFTLEVQSAAKPKAYSAKRPVNVASVPQRSPFSLSRWENMVDSLHS